MRIDGDFRPGWWVVKWDTPSEGRVCLLDDYLEQAKSQLRALEES